MNTMGKVPCTTSHGRSGWTLLALSCQSVIIKAIFRTATSFASLLTACKEHYSNRTTTPRDLLRHKGAKQTVLNYQYGLSSCMLYFLISNCCSSEP